MKPTAVFISVWLGLAGLVHATNPAMPTIPATIFNVTNYGAIGDGAKDNTTNIQNTINAASAAGGGIVEIPAGTFLSGPITLLSSINLQVDTNAMLQMLPLGTYPGGATNAQTFIGCDQVHDLEISGWGRIDGQGAAWWTFFYTNNTIVRPMMLNLYSCNRLFIHDITFQNPPGHHCGLRNYGGNITISNLTVNTVSPSPNTDGLNFVGTNSIIENCHISVGDDNIAMGATGPLYDLVITNCTFGTGHGVSFGSGNFSGISNLVVIDCTFNGTVNGLRIKYDNDGGGLVQNVYYYNIGMTNVNFPILIYSYYNEIGTPRSISPYYASTQVVAAVTGTTPIYRNITFSNITANSVSGYPVGIIWARTEMPATNIVFNKINLTGDRNFCLYNVSGAQFIDSKITVSATSNTFALFNAQVIISNSVPTNTLFTFAGLTTNGYGNSFAFYNAQASLKDTNAFDDGPLTLGASTFTVSNNLTLFPSTVLNYVLDTNANKVVVAGNLALGGTINVTNGTGFTNGSYTLMTYATNLSGALPTLGSAPDGYDYAFDTNTAGQVKLVATYTGVFETPTTNTIQSSANPSTYGTVVTFTATVNPAPTNGETVTFKDGATTLGTGTLSGGQATFNTTATQLVAGSHSITAIYAGDGAYRGSTSSVLTQTVNPPAGTFFSDRFDTSTVNSPTPAAPTATSSSYEVLSGKPWNPNPPAIGTGHLMFGIGSTSSGVVEVQALFASPGIALLSAGDYVQLSVTFTNTAGILSQSGFWGFGLYNSGGVAPIGGGLNSTMTTGSSTAATGGAQNWQGYVAQIGYTGANSGFYDRKPQTGTNNNNQDLVTTGTSSSYRNPDAVGIGTASTTPSVTLTVGSQYTEVLTYTLTSSNAIQLQSQLYTGTNATGTLLSTMTATTGTTPLTTTFDGFAVGWRATGSTASTMTISSIIVAGQTTTVAPTIGQTFSGSTLTLSWPNYPGWLLQSNSVGLASTNWSIVPDSGNATNFSITIDPAMTNVFYRLVSP